MEPDEPEEEQLEDGDVTPMVSEMVQMHEVFLAAMEGGFSEWQAMQIVCAIVLKGAN